ncbi:ParB/RepB/Spo0J family partition protein [Vibrio sp. PNB22_3_1]|uniref:ParB/RepB/Spo0J family partition protein n=1 Tax=unclassified Vibrio TaxID=2614977 RepID=UPI0014855641|nr:ParB N-terminal domain-containing protein [Vibrio sp. F13]
MKSAKIKINKITVPATRMRPVSKVKISELMKSIHTIGLISPIVLASDRATLIAGAHRLEACRELGLEEIDARIVLTDEDARLIELDENLKRNDLKPAQKKEHALKRIDEIMLRMRDEVYEQAISGSIQNGNLSKKDAPEALLIARGQSSLESASNNKVKEAAKKALNLIQKKAIEVAEGEFELSQRYLRDALRARKKEVELEITFDDEPPAKSADEFKVQFSKRARKLAKEFRADLKVYETHESYGELLKLVERLESL